MATKVNTRIILKNDELSNWLSAENRVDLKTGELVLAKVGDKYEVRVGQGGKYDTAAQLQISASQVVGLESNLNALSTSFSEVSALTDLTGTYTNGSIAVVTADIDGSHTSYTAYYYDAVSSTWRAMDGNYNAGNVYFDSDITLAGAYTEVGNVKLTDGTLAAKGKSVSELMTQIFTKELSGSVKSNPSVTGTKLTAKVNGTGSAVQASKTYEYGTYLTDIAFSGATFNKGTYTYGPDSKQTAASWATTATNSVSVTTGSTSTTGTLESIVIGDQGKDTDNATLSAYTTVSSVKVNSKATVAADTVEANTNLGNTNTKAGFTKVAFGAQTPSCDSGTFSGYRLAFWGAVAATATQLDMDALTSAQVRALGNSQATTCPDSYTAKAGSKQIVFAMKAGTKSSLTAKDGNALNSPVVFTKKASAVNVEGANGYTAVAYDIWYCVLDSATGAAKDMDLALTWA